MTFKTPYPGAGEVVCSWLTQFVWVWERQVAKILGFFKKLTCWTVNSLLFNTYMTCGVGEKVIHWHEVQFHQYAESCIFLLPGHPSEVIKFLSQCLQLYLDGEEQALAKPFWDQVTVGLGFYISSNWRDLILESGWGCSVLLRFSGQMWSLPGFIAPAWKAGGW